MNRTIHQAPDTPKGLEATPVLTPTPVGNLAGTPYRPAAFGSLCEALDYASEGVTGFNFHGPAGELRAVLGYADLRRAARARAAKLRALGLPPGERVAIVADMTPDFIIGFFACQYAGLLAVPLPKPTGLGGRDSYDRQLGQVLDNSGARLILHAPELTETVTRVAADRRRTAGAPHCLTHDGLDAMAAAPGGLAPLGPAAISNTARAAPRPRRESSSPRPR